MKKIIILGSPGAGKSVFGRRLRDKTGIELYPLDMIFWRPDKTYISKEEFQERVAEVLNKDSWIIDGLYVSSIDTRLSACDTIFLLDYPLEVCLKGVEARNGKKREDLPWVDEPDPEFIDFIKNTHERTMPLLREKLAALKDKQVIVFHSREEALAYLGIEE